MLDHLFPTRRAYISASSAATILALVTAGTLVTGQGSQPIRALLPSGPNYSLFGTTVLGSEALPVGGATLVSGTKYKIATALLAPNPGGNVPAVFFYTNGTGYDGTSTPTVIPRIAANTAIAVTANTWAMPGDGFFYFDLGRAVTANDVFELPQRSGVQMDRSNMRVLGGTFVHCTSYGVYIGLTQAISNIEIGYVTIKWGNSDGINVKGATGKTCSDVRIHHCLVYEMAYDGSGGGDAISFEDCSPGHSGSIRNCILTRCAKSGLGMSESNIVVYHDLLLDGCSVAIAGSGSQPGSHTFSRIRMVNGWTTPATGIHGFYIFSAMSISTVVTVNGLSMHPGTNATTGLRAFRAQSGTVTVTNSVIDSHGAAVPFDAGFFTTGTSGTFAWANLAAGGNASIDFFGFTPVGTDITLTATPYNNAATGDLSPNSKTLGKGVGGVDIGYTAVAA